MGSLCEIQLFHDSRIEAKHLARQLIAEVNRLERKYSRYLPESLVSTINDSARKQLPIKIDHETEALLDHAQSCFQTSEGYFDITAGVLSKLWDFRAAKIPDEDAIANALSRIGFQKLRWQDCTLIMPPDMEIDFGGIVKEYAADACAALARSLGFASGLVNLGGDFAVIGPHPHTHFWPIGIVNPENHQRAIATLNLVSGGLASSGDYARFFIHQGKRYSHLINPKTGWPSSGLRAVSVTHSLCTVAGSLATIAMLKEQDEAIEWLSHSGAAYVYMTRDGHTASGFSGSLK